MYVVSDLDSTLANCDHRLQYIQDEGKDWDTFFEECHHDTPIRNNIEILYALGITRTVLILSGRSDVVRGQTEEWLDKWNVRYDALVMRPEGNYRPDIELKRKWVELLGLTPANTLVVLEDRDSCVEMYRSLGLNTFQVKDGSY